MDHDEIQTCAFQAFVSWRIVLVFMVLVNAKLLKSGRICTGPSEARHRSQERGDGRHRKARGALPRAAKGRR